MLHRTAAEFTSTVLGPGGELAHVAELPEVGKLGKDDLGGDALLASKCRWREVLHLTHRIRIKRFLLPAGTV